MATFMCVHVCVCVCATCMCVRVCVCYMYVCACVCVLHVHVCVCVCVCVFATCTCVCMCATCVCVCVCVCMLVSFLPHATIVSHDLIPCLAHGIQDMGGVLRIDRLSECTAYRRQEPNWLPLLGVLR